MAQTPINLYKLQYSPIHQDICKKTHHIPKKEPIYGIFQGAHVMHLVPPLWRHGRKVAVFVDVSGRTGDGDLTNKCGDFIDFMGVQSTAISANFPSFSWLTERGPTVALTGLSPCMCQQEA
jgi:hypothetical protein